MENLDPLLRVIRSVNLLMWSHKTTDISKGVACSRLIHFSINIQRLLDRGVNNSEIPFLNKDHSLKVDIFYLSCQTDFDDFHDIKQPKLRQL